MAQAADTIRLFTLDDTQAPYQPHGQGSDDDAISVGFARHEPGASNALVVGHDEALVVTRGAFSVTADDGHGATAHPGEVIFVPKGTRAVYSAQDAGADVLHLTYPHGPADNVALMRRIWEPIARGESDDQRPFFDALADDVVFELPVGELRGKQAVIDYLAGAGTTMEINPFVRPLEYYGAGDRVVVLGDETFRVRETGVSHRAEWAWVHDLHEGRITRIVAIQDLSGIAGLVEEAVAKARVSAE